MLKILLAGKVAGEHSPGGARQSWMKWLSTEVLHLVLVKHGQELSFLIRRSNWWWWFEIVDLSCEKGKGYMEVVCCMPFHQNVIRCSLSLHSAGFGRGIKNYIAWPSESYVWDNNSRFYIVIACFGNERSSSRSESRLAIRVVCVVIVVKISPWTFVKTALSSFS